MNYRTIGKTGLKVSEIGLGTEYLYNQPRETVVTLIQNAINNGINYFDLVFNVSHYIKNLSEGFKGFRDKIIITSHLGTTEIDGKAQRTRDLKESEKAFLNTLSILKIDYVDFINIQFVKNNEYEAIISKNGLLGLAKRLQEEGKARFIGVSTHDISIGMKAAKSGNFDMIMNQINLVNNAMPGKSEFLKTCEKERIGLIAIKPFAGGKLLQRNHTVYIAKYQSGGISLKKKIPSFITPIKCLNYTLSQVGVSSTIPGIKNLQELEEIYTYFTAPEDEKDFSDLLRVFENIF